MVLKNSGEIGRNIKVMEQYLGLINENWVVADVGCGEGESLKFLTRICNLPKENVYGFDISTKYLKKTKKYSNNVYVWNPEVKSCPVKQKFDLIVCFDVVEHVTNTDNFIKNIAMSMRGGGRLLLCTPNAKAFSRYIQKEKWYANQDETHLKYFSREMIVKVLKEGGLEMVAIKTVSSTRSGIYNALITHTMGGGQLLVLAKKR